MSTQNLPDKPYRIESRRVDNPRDVWAKDFADKRDADLHWAWYVSAMVPAGPQSSYAPRGEFRLVMLGPDRTVLPEVSR